MTQVEFDQICRDVCPHCATDAPLRQRDDTKEFTHDWPGKHAFCLASHFRNKWKDQISG